MAKVRYKNNGKVSCETVVIVGSGGYIRVRLFHTCPSGCKPHVVCVLQILLGIINNKFKTLDRTAIDPSIKPTSKAGIYKTIKRRQRVNDSQNQPTNNERVRIQFNS